VVASGLLQRLGWEDIRVSPDIGEVVSAHCGAECYYPYGLSYSGGQALKRVEHIVEAVLP
jgi:hypothetical protein